VSAPQLFANKVQVVDSVQATLQRMPPIRL